MEQTGPAAHGSPRRFLARIAQTLVLSPAFTRISPLPQQSGFAGAAAESRAARSKRRRPARSVGILPVVSTMNQYHCSMWTNPAANKPPLVNGTADGYGSVWILKEAVERTGVADKVKVGEMINSMDIKDGPAAMAYPGPVNFDPAGHRVGAPLIIVQWQNGVPVTVYPVDRALAVAKWSKSA